MIHVKDKELVVPGEILAEEDYYSGRGTFKEGSKICSSLMGLVSLRNKKISVIPLKSKYVPKKGDVIIGEINDIRFSMWGVDVNSPYSGILPASEVFGREKRELNKVFKIGDVLFLRVVDVDEVKKVKLGLKGRGMGKFKGGILVNITPTKVPRLIGKRGSMINMIKDKTRCKIVVGQNGLVWVKGDKDMEQITKNIINIIEAQAHTSGLTNRIRDKLYLLVDGEIPENLEGNSDSEEYFKPEDISQTHLANDSKKMYTDDETDKELERPKLQNFKKEIEFDEFEFNSTEKEITNNESNKANLEIESRDVKNIKENLSSNNEKSKRSSFLDTFDHLKKQNKDNNKPFGKLSKVEELDSPTLSILNDTSNLNENKGSNNKNFSKEKKDSGFSKKKN